MQISKNQLTLHYRAHFRKHVFLYRDAFNTTILNILKDRRLPHLKAYFLRFSKAACDSVTHIVIDMYTPCMSLIKDFFQNLILYQVSSMSYNFFTYLMQNTYSIYEAKQRVLQ